MKARTHLACGYCAHFTIKAHPDQAAYGLGACVGFEGITGPIEPFVHATARPCVQYVRASDLTQRSRFVDKHTQGETDSSTHIYQES